MNKYAIIILSDASNKSDESLGRVLNALVLASDLKSKDSDIQVFFQGAGTRSVNVLEDNSHPGHGLYQDIKDRIKGASKACANVFSANITNIPLLSEFDIPGIGGATSLATYIEKGYHPIIF